MKLYLTKDVKKIGTKGQLITVSEGFGRNYLLAQGLASVQPVVVQTKKIAPTVSELELKRLRELTTPLRISAAASASGTLYQAISPETISAELRKQLHLRLRPADLTVAEPVKALGSFVCTVHDRGSIIATLSCEVIKL